MTVVLDQPGVRIAPDPAEAAAGSRADMLTRKHVIDSEVAAELVLRGWRQTGHGEGLRFCATCDGPTVWLDQAGIPRHHHCTRRHGTAPKAQFRFDTAQADRFLRSFDKKAAPRPLPPSKLRIEDVEPHPDVDQDLWRVLSGLPVPDAGTPIPPAPPRVVTTPQKKKRASKPKAEKPPKPPKAPKEPKPKKERAPRAKKGAETPVTVQPVAETTVAQPPEATPVTAVLPVAPVANLLVVEGQAQVAAPDLAPVAVVASALELAAAIVAAAPVKPKKKRSPKKVKPTEVSLPPVGPTPGQTPPPPQAASDPVKPTEVAVAELSASMGVDPLADVGQDW